LLLAVGLGVEPMNTTSSNNSKIGG